MFYLAFRVSSKETSLRVPSQSSHKETCPITERSFSFPKVPDKGNQIQVPQRGPYGERCSVSRANGLFIHSFVSLRESPVKDLSQGTEGKHVVTVH